MRDGDQISPRKSAAILAVLLSAAVLALVVFKISQLLLSLAE